MLNGGSANARSTLPAGIRAIALTQSRLYRRSTSINSSSRSIVVENIGYFMRASNVTKVSCRSSPLGQWHELDFYSFIKSARDSIEHCKRMPFILGVFQTANHRRIRSHKLRELSLCKPAGITK